MLTLPLDVWLLICEEFRARRDFSSLVRLTLTCRTLANFALPKLYSIYELESASADDASIQGKKKLATVWRAIILSSFGETAYPYCLWIKNLKLGDLGELLSDMTNNPPLQDQFFEGAMAPFKIPQDTLPAPKTARKNRRLLARQAITTKAGDSITKFVEEAAARDNKAVALTHLEGQYIPVDILPSWASRLATLTSLNIQDGSVVGEKLAVSIRDNCPKFKELICFYCAGETVDQNLAAFFRTLKPDTLEVFSVSSKNFMGKEAFSALSLHAKSLRNLGLSGLQATAFEYVGALRPCVLLRSLELESDRLGAANWKADFPDSFANSVSWLSACASMTDLKLWNVPCAALLLRDILRSPKLHLKTMDLKLIDGDDEFYTSLAKQTALEGFFLRTSDELLDHPTLRHTQFISSICQWPELRVLDIMQTSLSPADLKLLASALGHLEELSFDGDGLGDSIWDSFLAMRSLRTITINAITVFTVDGILGYINSLSAMGIRHGEARIMIMNQALEYMISKEEQQFLDEHALSTIGGKVDIGHPEEEHESDFSD